MSKVEIFTLLKKNQQYLSFSLPKFFYHLDAHELISPYTLSLAPPFICVHLFSSRLKCELMGGFQTLHVVKNTVTCSSDVPFLESGKNISLDFLGHVFNILKEDAISSCCSCTLFQRISSSVQKLQPCRQNKMLALCIYSNQGIWYIYTFHIISAFLK